MSPLILIIVVIFLLSIIAAAIDSNNKKKAILLSQKNFVGEEEQLAKDFDKSIIETPKSRDLITTVKILVNVGLFVWGAAIVISALSMLRKNGWFSLYIFIAGTLMLIIAAVFSYLWIALNENLMILVQNQVSVATEQAKQYDLLNDKLVDLIELQVENNKDAKRTADFWQNIINK
ncbi:MAG: hypothetical protein LBM27_03865 [Lactobacillaceae bacterium]|jgi:hypothetical protein|nr:hypothetical protein [Lactobacillaceae bacterium]